MGAMLTIRNDGPEACEVNAGRLSIVIPAGAQRSVVVNTAVRLDPIAPMSEQERIMHGLESVRPLVMPAQIAHDE